MGENHRVILIDGSGYFFRAYYAITHLTTSKGFPTNAIYGFINMLMKVLEVEKPNLLAIAFDTAKPTFRKVRYADYKANRTAPPDDLIVQIPYIMRAVEAFGVCQLVKEGFEADDLLGTVARVAEREGFKVEIITGDKDLMQLVNNNITLYDSMKEVRYDAGGVKEKMGVRPDQIVDYLALRGDSSDNIPGVSGIGEKSAVELLTQFDSLDGVYRRIEEIKSEKRRETLIREKETAYLSQELATLKCDVLFPFKLGDLKYAGPVMDKLKALFEELEFQNLLKRFELKHEPLKLRTDYTMVTTQKQLNQVASEIREMHRVCVDTETTSLKTRSASLVGIALSCQEGRSYYIPIGHTVLGTGELALSQLPNELVKGALKDVLEDPLIQKIGQNLKYDLQILKNWGVELKGVVVDTMLASYLLDPERPHNLDALALRYLDHKTLTYKDVTGKGKSQISFADVALDVALKYSAEDADITLRLSDKLVPEVHQSKQLKELFETIEIPLVGVLADMEYEGVLVDRDRLDQMSAELNLDLGQLEKVIYELAGKPFNINSPKQLSDVLFNQLHLPSQKKTKTGLSTDESVLSKLRSKHPVIEKLLEYRELSKLKSTYVEGLLGEISQATGRVHTHYNQTTTATGRLSSSNPNLQNIPLARNEKYDIRSVFLAAPGYQLLSSDYSQIELRLLAHLSKDEILMESFRKDEDVHERTARLIFGCEVVSNDQRKVAKTINFGVMYGQTPFGLSQTLGISLSEAKDFIEKYFKRYHGVKKFLETLIEKARESGYAETVWGRKRFIPEIRSANRMRREMAERAAVNAPIQGTAADLIKRAMIDLHRHFIDGKMASKIILQVHDELVCEVAESECEKAESIVRSQMENAMQLDVPLKVDMGWGKNWRACG